VFDLFFALVQFKITTASFIIIFLPLYFARFRLLFFGNIKRWLSLPGGISEAGHETPLRREKNRHKDEYIRPKQSLDKREGH
jgi:hypothetical protein